MSRIALLMDKWEFFSMTHEVMLSYFLFQGALRKLPNTSGKQIDYAKLASVVVNYGTAWMALTRKGLIKEG